MILHDGAIIARRNLPKGDKLRLAIEPWVGYDERRHVVPAGAVGWGLDSAGYDLRLGYNYFPVAAGDACIDPKTFRVPNASIIRAVKGEPIVIPAHGCALMETVEWIEVPSDCVAVLQGRSTLARCFLNLNTTALEPGWRGRPTLEAANLTGRPLRLWPGEGVCCVRFHRTIETCILDYNAKPGCHYQNAEGLQGPSVG